jgi:hypothetical protein
MDRFDQLVIENLRREMARYYGPDSCIAATRLVHEYLEPLGWDGDGIQVEAAVFNRHFLKYFMEKRVDTQKAFDRRASSILRDHPDAWTVGVGFADPPKHEGLHVVYLGYKGDDILFADLSIDQAARPNHDMPIVPVCAFLDSDECRGFLLKAAPVVIENNGGAVIRYEFRGGDKWKSSGNWGARDAGLRADIIERAKNKARLQEVQG